MRDKMEGEMLFNKAVAIDFLTNNHKIMSQWKQFSLTEEQVESFFELLRKEILQDVKCKRRIRFTS